jgi:hypothetical protein
MDNKVLLQIRTGFWCHSILESLGMKDFSELAKLYYLNRGDFRSKYGDFFPNKTAVDNAHHVLCTEAFNIETWRGYFNGKKIPNTKIKNGLNAYEFIGTALPQTQAMYENGPYNLLKVLTSYYIKAAIIAFADGVTALYKDNNIEIITYELNVDTMKQEISSTFQKCWDINILRGHFDYCHSQYHTILTEPGIQLSKKKYILELMSAYIELNFFGKQPDKFSGILIQGHAINYIKNRYGIETSLWAKAIPIFSDALTHFSDNKDQIHWIDEEEAQFLTD